MWLKPSSSSSCSVSSLFLPFASRTLHAAPWYQGSSDSKLTNQQQEPTLWYEDLRQKLLAMHSNNIRFGLTMALHNMTRPIIVVLIAVSDIRCNYKLYQQTTTHDDTWIHNTDDNQTHFKAHEYHTTAAWHCDNQIRSQGESNHNKRGETATNFTGNAQQQQQALAYFEASLIAWVGRPLQTRATPTNCKNKKDWAEYLGLNWQRRTDMHHQIMLVLAIEVFANFGRKGEEAQSVSRGKGW